MKREHEVRQLFADHGLTIHTIRRNRHWVVKASKIDGQITTYTIPTSPSDHRSMKNTIADLKRGGRRHAGVVA